MPSPPDVESLRVYLTLPLYHGFDQPLLCNGLHKPFAKSVLQLKPEALKIVGLWWSQTPKEYFERLIKIYKDVLSNNLQQPKVAESKVSTFLFLVISFRFFNDVDSHSIKIHSFSHYHSIALNRVLHGMLRSNYLWTF